MNKLKKFALFALALFVIVLLSLLPSWYKKQPKLNPHPKYFITIYGHVAPEYKNKIYIVFQQSFVGSSPKCTFIANHFEGVKANPTKQVNYYPKIDEQGNYSIKIPTDKYKPGYCHWEPWSLGISLTNNPKELLVTGFSSYGSSQDKTNARNINYICQKNAFKCYFTMPKGSLIPFSYHLNKSYRVGINFIFKN